MFFFVRFFEREVNFGLKLLAIVRTDLDDVVAITSGGKACSATVDRPRILSVPDPDGSGFCRSGSGL